MKVDPHIVIELVGGGPDDGKYFDSRSPNEIESLIAHDLYHSTAGGAIGSRVEIANQPGDSRTRVYAVYDRVADMGGVFLQLRCVGVNLDPNAPSDGLAS